MSQWSGSREGVNSNSFVPKSQRDRDFKFTPLLVQDMGTSEIDVYTGKALTADWAPIRYEFGLLMIL